MLPDREEVQDSTIRAIFEENAPMLLRVAVRVTGSWEAAEDAVQDAFSKMVEKQIVFPTADDAKYWLIRVVKNNAINWSKRRSREYRAYESWWKAEAKAVQHIEAGSSAAEGTGAEAGTERSAEETLLEHESAEAVRRALDQLPDNLRMVLVLKEFEGMNYKEIGKVLGISEGNVKVRAFRARQALLSLLEKEEGHVSR